MLLFYVVIRNLNIYLNKQFVASMKMIVNHILIE